MKARIDKTKFHIDNTYFLEPIDLGQLRLIQIGERFCGKNQGYPEHKQLCREITFVYDGVALNTVDNVTTVMKKNTLNLSFAPHMHEITATETDNLRYFFLGFDLTDAHPLYPEYQRLQTLPPEKLYAVPLSRTHAVFLDALSAVSSDDPLSRFCLSTAVNQILIDCMFALNGTKKALDNTFRPSEVTLFLMLSHLDENYLTFKNLDALSAQLGYSVSYLSHLFASAMQRSASDYVHEKKMHHAAKLIVENRLSITEIAPVLCYDSVHAFSKAFKKYFGLSPIAYRAEFM